MAREAGLLECPMCDFTVLPTDDYILQLHFEQAHTTDSPFIIENDPEPPLPTSAEDTPSSDDGEESTATCPEPSCGELVPLPDFNDHLDFHAAESLSFDETTGKYRSHHSSATVQTLAAHQPSTTFSKSSSADHNSIMNTPEASYKYDERGHKLKKRRHRHRSDTNSSEKSTLSRSIITFNPFTESDKSVKPPSKSARLGKSELGPYAYEERMPKWLYDQLAVGPKITVVNRIGRDGRLIRQEQVQNETPGAIPILAQLSALDRTVKEAYYCHPSTLHVGKTPREGGFCGYRNIQMLLSYIQGAKAQGHEEFPGRTPGILKVQDLIESAWDKGINHIGRIQTGGIRGTRKYIGTPEAQAFFLSSEIDCAVEMFSDNKERKIDAHETLLDAIERYFARAAVKDGSNVYKTLLPPIYLQQPGHSITIVGFERRRDGACNLVVFDPMYSTSPAMHKLLGRKNIQTARPEVMHAYRRGSRQLRKHAAFEILMLTATPPLFPAWDVLRQFPDCRFVYAFFRSRTLGYDVYPEDYFLSNFPWQQYGRLWICDDARFARSDPVMAVTAQALRRITSEGTSPHTSSRNSPIGPFTTHSFCHMPATNAHMKDEAWTQLPSYIPSYDGSVGQYLASPQSYGSSPKSKMGGFSTALPQPGSTRPSLSLLTDVGRKYPGFPTPLSPTHSAKDLYPSPASATASRATTPCLLSPAARSVSPMSIDGSEMCGPSRRCYSHGYHHYASTMGLIDHVIASDKGHSNNLRSLPSPPRDPLSSPVSLSPKTTMLQSMFVNQILPATDFHLDSSYCSTSSSPTSPSISIANGTETYIPSPLSPTGTLLSYTSSRPISSGLLGVRPLSESDVAQYRFWSPCGRHECAFGCSSIGEGERQAARRLFKSLSEGWDGDEGREVQAEDEGPDGAEEVQKSAWAGRRLVSDWNGFLRGCEREGVARF